MIACDVVILVFVLGGGGVIVAVVTQDTFIRSKQTRLKQYKI